MIGRWANLFRRQLSKADLGAGWAALRAGDIRRASDILAQCQSEGYAPPETTRLAAHILWQQHAFGAAAELLEGALRVQPSAQLLIDLAGVRLAMHSADAAAAALKAALVLEPNHADALIRLAALYHQQGRSTEASECLTKLSDPTALSDDHVMTVQVLLRAFGKAGDADALLASRVMHADCSVNLIDAYARRLADLGNHDDALQLAGMAVLRHPQAAAAHYLQGTLLESSGQPESAINAMQVAARLAPTDGNVLHALGTLLGKAGYAADAIDYLELSIHHAPERETAWIELVDSLIKQGELESARGVVDRFVLQHAGSANAWFWKGNVLTQQGDLDESCRVYEISLQKAKSSVAILTNYGLALLEQGRIEHALDLLNRAATLAPQDPSTQMNLGLAYRFAGNLHAALAHFEAARSLAPDDRMTLYHLSTTHLLNGNFSEGWDLYGTRWLQDMAPKRRPSSPSWGGADLSQSRLLIWGEQGLGDQIMFASCFNEVASLARSCIIECNPRLTALFQRSFPACSIVGGTTQADIDNLERGTSVDVHAPMGDLPGRVRRSRADFPRHTGYLSPERQKVLHWKELVARLDGTLKVGISWIGGTRQTGKGRRSMSLETWVPLLALPEVAWVSLQYTPCRPELQAVRTNSGIHVTHWQEAIDDLDEMAALISTLDAVVTVCNTTVHLAGALGTPVWVLTPFAAEWRYLAQGVSMPWYPSAKLVRQQTPDDWYSVLDSVRQELVTQIGRNS